MHFCTCKVRVAATTRRLEQQCTQHRASVPLRRGSGRSPTVLGHAAAAPRGAPAGARARERPEDHPLSHHRCAAPPAPLCVCLLSALRVRGGADDMGWYDSQPHNPTSPTPTLGQWAKEGILLERHYVCESPQAAADCPACRLPDEAPPAPQIPTARRHAARSSRAASRCTSAASRRTYAATGRRST